MPSYARVIIDDSADREFDYLIPDGLNVEVGSRVRVPVRTRALLGTVVEVLDHTDVAGIRPLTEVIGDKPAISPVLLTLVRWIADYYCCPLGTAMRSVLPQVIRRAEMGHKTQLFVRLTRLPTEEELAVLQRRAPRQADILGFLATQTEPVTMAALTKQCGASSQTVRALERDGFLVTTEEALERDPHAADVFLPAAPHELNEEQITAMAAVRETIGAPADHAPVLLHGVTGSGKTEIYLQGIQLALDQGRTAIILVPEISLTPQTVERFKSRFADSQQRVAVLHSHLSQGERHDEWHKIREGRARIVIGARSAIFAPVENLGLIVVDEEHETSYKQEDAPRYHARDVAVLRGKLEGCAVLLGSATPSLESYRNATLGKYRLIKLTRRVDERTLPVMRVVDMRQEISRNKGPSIISERLRMAISARLAKKEQSILFLNRRGYSTSLICPQCGHVCQCPNCSVSLTFHRGVSKLICHICGHNSTVPSRCPECRDPQIKYAGMGTEKIEDIVCRMFPDAKVQRMDADAMTRKDAYRETLGAFRAGRIDILVGTQMIAKGLHFPNVTLVGIINADLALHLPDFRASERTFQLLTQVAGRAGRGEMQGEVFVQTFTPFSPAIQFARQHDFEGFWQQECEFRDKYNYPPFTHMILITVRSEHQTRGQFSADTLARRLGEHLPKGAVLGDPAPAPLEKSKGAYRFHLILRSRAIQTLSRYVRETLDRMTFPEEVQVAVDVDPYQLL